MVDIKAPGCSGAFLLFSFIVLLESKQSYAEEGFFVCRRVGFKVRVANSAGVQVMAMLVVG